MDGTLANSDHRKKWVMQKPKNWPAWNAGMAHDPPHMDIVQFAHIADERNIAVVICSGREDAYRDVTEKWLQKYNVPFVKTYMRKKGDYRDDSIVKKELLDQIRKDGYNPLLAFDDRDRVVKAWRECGIRCLQVAEGNF
jgi:hypothetical protein